MTHNLLRAVSKIQEFMLAANITVRKYSQLNTLNNKHNDYFRYTAGINTRK